MAISNLRRLNTTIESHKRRKSELTIRNKSDFRTFFTHIGALQSANDYKNRPTRI